MFGCFLEIQAPIPLKLIPWAGGGNLLNTISMCAHCYSQFYIVIYVFNFILYFVVSRIGRCQLVNFIVQAPKLYDFDCSKAQEIANTKVNLKNKEVY